MVRVFIYLGVQVAAFLAYISLTAQAPLPTVQTFEVASIKPNTSGQPGGSFALKPGGVLEIRNNTLRNMVRNAYQLQNFEIVGGPDWFDRDRFDVTAKAANGDTTANEILAMVHTLMAERFKLVIHREKREVPTYALVVARADGRLGEGLSAGPDLFTAIEEQLGLKLESRREPADVLVVDSASRPQPD